MQTTYRKNWILSNTLGTFLSLIIAAAILTFVSRLIGEPSSITEKLINLGVAVGGGLICGTVLAWFQWRMLSQRYEDFLWTPWWGKTVLAFIASWLLAIVPSFTYTGQNPIGQVIPPFGIPIFTVLYGSIIFGAVMGALLGYAQWFELRKHRKSASRWIGLNVFSWAAGIFVLVLLGLIFAGQISIFLLSGVAGGLITALCVAGVTSSFFKNQGETA